MNLLTRFCLAAALCLSAVPAFSQKDSAALSISGGQKTLQLPLFPGIDQYKVFGATDLNGNFSLKTSGLLSGWTWTDSIQTPQEFYRVEAVPMSANDTLTALVLNRLAYGPTPDELERVKSIGPDAYIAEQLAPENISQSLDIDQVAVNLRDWQRVVVTAPATSQLIYIYQSTVGDVYIDDLKVVAGTNPDVGVNLVPQGDFEALTAWTVSTNMSDSALSTAEVHGGATSLHVISTTAGSTQGSAIWQTLPSVVANAGNYTLSFWWKPGTNLNSGLIVRFSGSTVDTGLYAAAGAATLATKLENNIAFVDDLRAWHVLHALRSKKQLEEILLQFLENHFVTQVSKTRDYFDQYYDGDDIEELAARTEYKENVRWRAALENPSCTFSNLLRISAESPAQIIYLDTVNSRGDGSNIPNENYARELMELFSMGVDNGYDQTDITLMSRIWSGWSVDIVNPADELNPLAARSTTLRPGGTNIANVENLSGIWSFNYKANRHWNQGSTILFPNKTVPARFGPPYAGRDYTFAVDVDANQSTNWQHVVATGTASSSTLYLYLNAPGDIFIDDVTLVAGSVAEVGANLVANGNFESGLTGWTVSPNHANSSIDTSDPHAGTRALHMVATEPGSSQSTAIYKTGLGLTANAPYTLSFWWRPGTNKATMTARLSGSGIVSTAPPRLAGDGLNEGYRVIGHISDLPFTQEFISVKLCRLFVNDNFRHGVYDYTDPNLSPEGQLIKACMNAWENNTPKGQIRKVLQVIFSSDLFRSQQAAMHKVKTPLEFTVSALRSLRTETTTPPTASTDGYNIKTPLDRMGAMKLFDRAEPDGYPEAAAPWISAGTLAERLRWVQSVLLPIGAAGRGDINSATYADPVALLKKKLPSTQWNDAAAVTDYFLSIIVPGEGRGNLDLYRQAAINFLNTADNGASSPFSGIGNTNTTYDTRVRGVVSAILTSPRFEEQ